MKYTFRITVPRDDEMLINFFKDYKCIFAYENATNDHYHGYIEFDDLTKLRNKIKYKFPKHYSLVPPVDEFKYLRYLVKDGVIVYNTLISNELLVQIVASDNLVKEEIQEKKEKRQKRAKTYSEKIIEEYETELVNIEDCGYVYIKSSIVNYLNKTVHLKCKLINRDLMVRLYWGIYREYFPSQFASVTRNWYDFVE